jgi:hypothetical protein
MAGTVWTGRTMLGRLAAAVALGAMGALGSATWGQGATAPALPDTHLPPAQPVLIEWGDEPLRLDAVGLTMQLPLGSTAQSSSAGSDVTARIVGKGETWLINVRTPRLPGDLNLTASDVLEQIMVQIATASGEVFVATSQDERLANKPRQARMQDAIGSYARLLAPPQTVVINGRSAERAYIELPPIRQSPASVRGVTVFQTGPVQFVVIDLTTFVEEFERVRPIYESTLATTRIESDSDVTTRRAAAVALGARVLDGLDESKYEAALKAKPTRWLRRYRPASTGSDRDAEELGYARISTTVGRRGLVGGAGAGGGGAGDDQGYLVQVDFRMLDGRNGITDSRGIYFMTPDRQEEVWKVENAVRRDGKSIITIETGGRVGKSMSVRVEGQGRAPMTVKPILQGDGYITIVEDLLMPRFLIEAGIPGDFGFYAYRSDTGSIRYRRDELVRDPEEPKGWLLTTTRGDDARNQVSRYTVNGDLIRTTLPDGSVWEPTTPESLMRLWKDKGLPLD